MPHDIKPKCITADCIRDTDHAGPCMFRAAKIPPVKRSPGAARPGRKRGDSTCPHTTLTARERQVLWGIARGVQAHHIAALLGISIKTVEKHREHVAKKIGFSGPAPMTRYAIAIGLIPVPTLADFANPKTVTAGIGITEAGKPTLGMPCFNMTTVTVPRIIECDTPGPKTYAVNIPSGKTAPSWMHQLQRGVRRDAPDYEPTTDKEAK